MANVGMGWDKLGGLDVLPVLPARACALAPACIGVRTATVSAWAWGIKSGGHVNTMRLTLGVESVLRPSESCTYIRASAAASMRKGREAVGQY